MKKRKFSVALMLGLCLILCSISLATVLYARNRIGVQHSQAVVSKIEGILPDRSAGVPGEYPNPGMPALEVDGVNYIALLEIPAYDILVPVADAWNSDKLSLSPARFFGSTYDNSLIIGGADHPKQFGFCDEIGHNEQIVVTDMTGAQFTYTVSAVDRANHAQTQWLADPNSDLTLFCHNPFGMEYIAVRCVFVGR